MGFNQKEHLNKQVELVKQKLQQHYLQLEIEAKNKGDKDILAAHQDAQKRINAAHLEAKKSVNSAKIDHLYSLSDGAVLDIDLGTGSKNIINARTYVQDIAFASNPDSSTPLWVAYMDRIIQISKDENGAFHEGFQSDSIFASVYAIRLAATKKHLFWIEKNGKVGIAHIGSGHIFDPQLTLSGNSDNWSIYPWYDFSSSLGFLVSHDDRISFHVFDAGPFSAKRNAANGGSKEHGSLSPPKTLSPLDIIYTEKEQAVFWVDNHKKAIMRGSLDPSSAEILYPVHVPQKGIALDNDSKQIYWLDSLPEKIDPALLYHFPLYKGPGEGLKNLGHSFAEVKENNVEWIPDETFPLEKKNLRIPQLYGRASYFSFSNETADSQKAPDFSNGLTVSTWIKLDAEGGGNILEMYSNGIGGGHLRLSFNFINQDHHLFFNYDQSGDRMKTRWGGSTGTLKLKEWAHIAVVVNPYLSPGEIKFFVNGTSDTVTKFNITEPIFTENFSGARQEMGRGVHYTMVDLKIWNRVLSPQEIREEMDPPRTQTHLMRGSMDGNEPVEVVAPLDIATSIILDSKYKDECNELIEQHKKLVETSLLTSQKIQQAHQNANEQIAAKHTELEDTQQNYTSSMAKAHQEDAAKRKKDHDHLITTKKQANDAVLKAQQQKRQKITDAKADQETIKKQAYAKAASMKSKANKKLDTAKTKRDQNKKKYLDH